MRGLPARASRALVRRARRFGSSPADVARWLSLYRAGPARRGAPAVSYGQPLPPLSEPGRGGTVKFQRLARAFPDAGPAFNLLYLGSSDRPDDLRQLVWIARRRGAAFVWNQDGVAYPGWSGRRTRAINAPLALAVHAADHVVYQSEFCRLAADRFLGRRAGPSEVLHNAVDTSQFTPVPRPDRPLTLLLGGDQFQQYRVETALRTLAELSRELPDVRLLVAGRLGFASTEAAVRRTAEEAIVRLGLVGRVELVGRYSQLEAPTLFRRADILLHTKYNDPCPTTVLEAMSTGVPVVHSASGGVPELVGEAAGVGVPAPLDFERDHPPDPVALAEGVLRVWEAVDVYAREARRRAVERFDIAPWIEHHRQLFARLTA